jgi:hypothetical protein
MSATNSISCFVPASIEKLLVMSVTEMGQEKTKGAKTMKVLNYFAASKSSVLKPVLATLCQ